MSYQLHDYCSRASHYHQLSGLLQLIPNKLLDSNPQFILNTAAKVIPLKQKSDHVIVPLKNVQWLPTSFRVKLNILTTSTST